MIGIIKREGKDIEMFEGGGCGQSSEEVKVKMFLRFLRRKSVGINTQTLFDKLTQARKQRERERARERRNDRNR